MAEVETAADAAPQVETEVESESVVKEAAPSAAAVDTKKVDAAPPAEAKAKVESEPPVASQDTAPAVAADAAPQVGAESKPKVSSKETPPPPKAVLAAAVVPPPKVAWHVQLQEQAPAIYQFLRHQALVPATVVLLAVTIVSPSTVTTWLVWPIYYSLLQMIGIAVGVGLGLGLATHVYDQLEYWKESHNANGGVGVGVGVGGGGASANQVSLSRSQSRGSGGVNTSGNGGGNGHGGGSGNSNNLDAPHRSQFYSNKQQSSFQLQDEQTYESLMTAAGYSTDNNKLHHHHHTGAGTSASPGTSSSSSSSGGGGGTSGTTGDGKILRAHVLRSTSDFWALNYPFTSVTTAAELTAVDRMRDLWPTLPTCINEQLGRWIEHILRDYIAVWYHMVDVGCQYENAAQAQTERKEQKEQEKKEGGPESDQESAAAAAAAAAHAQQQQQAQAQAHRHMVYSVALHRRIPFLDRLYESMAILFGNLATRVEHVNILELILLKWTRVLAHTFKVYRALRKSVRHKALSHHPHASGTGVSPSGAAAPSGPGRSFRGKRRQQQQQQQQQQQSQAGEQHPETDAAAGTTSSPPEEGQGGRRTFGAVSEIAMTKEFLFAGKLHRAITFGLDVPSLLFADASGRECGTGTSDEDHQRVETDNNVLEERLYGTPLLKECELDYNRVVGHRMVRALLPRADFGSPIVSSLLTEIMGSSVLTSIMSCFCPEYLNGWIIKGLSASPPAPPEGEGGEGEGAGGDAEEEKEQEDENDEGLMRGWSHGGGGPAESRAGNPPDTAADPPRYEDIERTMSKAFDVSDAEPSSTEQPQRNVARGPAVKEEKPNAIPESDGLPPASLLNVPSSDKIVTPQKKAHVEEESVSFQLPDISAAEGGDDIITKLAMVLIELQQYMDFEECRQASSSHQAVGINWDDDGCRAAVLRLVLVIEAALTQGRCTYRHKASEGDEDDFEGSDGDVEDVDNLDDSERPVEVTLPDYESATLSQILMEMTSDIEAFEERVATDNVLAVGEDANAEKEEIAEDYHPTSTEQSTLRTLIAAWLHTGQVYRTVTVLVQAQFTILAPYYKPQAFLRSRANANAFVRQLKALDGVDILVDTMTVLASPRLDETTGDELKALAKQSSGRRVRVTKKSHEEVAPAISSFPAQYMGMSSSTPRHLDFHRNEAFASSLRSERERRAQSWESVVHDHTEGLPIIYRTKGSTEADMAWHKELHLIARIFYTGTNLVAIRDAARRKSSTETDSVSHMSEATDPEAIQTSLLTLETACPRRRIEVPDDDSSFLLRAQPRALNAIGVHRDQRNHDLSFRSFAAIYEEPALAAGADHYSGGRFLRRCLVRYYPSDRTASVALQADKRKVDQRKNKGTVPGTITVDKSSRATPFLSAEFLRERHLCQKWVPKGTMRTQSMLASTTMEQTDFTSMPRPGKAIDYVYRMSFFERPMIDLAGKHFAVHDSSSLGAHRADASALELSDAALSAALMMMDAGDDERAQKGAEAPRQNVEMGQDGYPIIWMKFSRKQDDSNVEVKPYRVSFVRAALLITTARQEAQYQCLIKCVRAGSAKSATKALTDAALKPALKLLEYAGSPSREKQSLLLRDLKLGINHIDRGQLRRNALLNPRFPTVITELTASIDDAVQSNEVSGVDLMGSTGTLYKIRCVATIDYIADEDTDGTGCYRVSEDGSIVETFREEWVVYRSFKDFQALHKQLKSEVSATESSGTAGSRLVGAAAFAFATGNNMLSRHRQRQVLIPSLSHATKAVSLAATRKSIMKRKECLHGYIEYLLSTGHLLCRCTELLLFLGAFYPLPLDVATLDPLGRTEMSWTVVRKRIESSGADPSEIVEDDTEQVEPLTPATRTVSTGSQSTNGKDEDLIDDNGEREFSSKSLRKIDMIPAIRNKIDKVPLSQVRNRVFELLRYQFGFENASFIRNRMLAALKTASFAVTSASEFRRTLYKVHTDHISATALAGWIDFGLGLLWPDGVFFKSAPPTTQQKLDEQANRAKEVLHESFPEQVRAILGQELTRDGLDIFHEMLQNRVVVKSMAYMLFDLLWLEVFPEIGDVLVCGAALDIDS